MDDKTLTVTVVGRRCVYIDDYRVAGSKPYVSENLPSWSFEADIKDLRYAIGRRPSSANKALQSRIEALEAALRIAAKAERDRIVAWLRSDKPDRDNGGPCRHVEHSQGTCICNELADALESQP